MHSFPAPIAIIIYNAGPRQPCPNHILLAEKEEKSLGVCQLIITEMVVSSLSNESGSEIVFFDLETNVPNKSGKKFWVLEFGAIVVCPRKLVELESYCTLIRPGDLSAVAIRSSRIDGITRKAVVNAPSFEEVADKIFSILDGRIWAGHNIRRFDCVRIKEAFAEIGRPAPVPVGIIDSLGVLTEKFGRRAGNMKMASLAEYFGLGQQKHRSLDDVRMNLEVVKHCATVLFLESSLPNVLNDKWNGNPGVTTRSRSVLDSSSTGLLDIRWKNSSTITTRSSRGKLPCGEETSRKSPPTSVPIRGDCPSKGEESVVQSSKQASQSFPEAFSFVASMIRWR